MKNAVFSYSPAVTKGLKKVTNLFQIGLFLHKKVKFAHFSTKQVCNVEKKNFQRLINVNSNFFVATERGNRAKKRGCLCGRIITPRNVGKNSQILRNPLKFAFLTLFGCK